jgi:hypothetical protein
MRLDAGSNPPPHAAQVQSIEAAMSTEPAPIDPTVLKSAMTAFKKRLKAMRLDDESSLGRGPMSGGGKSGIVAIVPPNQFPRAVWEALVEQGKLRRSGGGMYELASETS